MASPTVKLAQRIANAVKCWIDGGLAIEDRVTHELRAPKPGDVIVLVRQRGPLFDAILQALKKANVPVAGADRLKLSEHIAVMDLMALGDALTLEADDLALACVLKSPLFGLGEEDLYALAQGRTGTLAASVIERAKQSARFAEAAQMLSRWRSEAAALRPFDFYSRVLGRDRGRERVIARLGHEAADAIDEFLAQALSYEQTETPTIVGFLNFLRRAGTEVKRDLEVQSSAVRVMTVHGAKGLEAPLVVLADTTSIPDGRGTRLHNLPESEAFIWAGRKPLDSASEQAARLAADELREEEYRRLLYVALTRAADALIVCGYESGIALKEGCWYRLVRDALEAGNPADLVTADVPYAKVLRWRPEQAHTVTAVAAAPEQALTPPPWLKQAAEAPPAGLKRIIPSQLDPDDESRSPYARLATRGTRSHAARRSRASALAVPSRRSCCRAPGPFRSMVREHCERLADLDPRFAHGRGAPRDRASGARGSFRSGEPRGGGRSISLWHGRNSRPDRSPRRHARVRDYGGLQDGRAVSGRSHRTA